MNPVFDVTILELKEVHDLPGCWSEASYRSLLHQLEMDDIGDIAPEDLPDIAVMALQDFEPEAAAGHVLAQILGEKVRAGVRQNLAHQLKAERLYEEFSEIEHHAAIFTAAVILNQAFPRTFPLPAAVRLTLQVTAVNRLAARIIGNEPTCAFAARLVADGMDDNAVLCRLYQEQLAGTHFPEAEAIIWKTLASERVLVDGQSAFHIVIYTSWYWVRPLKSAPKQYQSTAYEDLP